MGARSRVTYGQTADPKGTILVVYRSFFVTGKLTVKLIGTIDANEA